MAEVQEFKYLGSFLCKHGSMEVKTRERAVQGKKEVASLRCTMKERSASMEANKGLCDGIILPIITN